ncbi:MAG: DHA2 family efflux MFS transporter permease subunit [Actinobacteria bacterium]|nr:DHA2 family efflux MFS transporter permease subunit [Actinomycetota bacterium]
MLSKSRRWLALGVLCLSLLLAVVDNTIVNVALPTLNKELGAGTTELQWIVDAYTLVFSALLLAMGHFGDRFGRKRALQIGLVVFAITSALAALATTSGQLIGARALMGIGAALIFPATLAIIVNVFTDPKERAAAIGIWTAMVGVAVAIGPIVGGLLLEHFWWGSIFMVNIPVVIVAIVLGAFLLPESRDPKVGRMDYRGLVLSAAGVGLVIWAIIEGPSWGWTSPAILAALVGGLVVMAVFVLVERRLAHPLLDVRLFKNARFTAASLSIATAFFALFGFIFLITQYLQFIQGFSPLEAGIRTLPFAVATGVMSPVAIVLMHRFGSKAIVVLGLFVMAAGFVIAATVKEDTPYFGAVVISMVTIAAGLGLATSPATESIMGALPAEQAGVGSAVNDTTRELGGTLGVAVVGSVFLSVYGAKVIDGYRSLGLPPQYESIVRESMGGGIAVAEQLPAGPAAQLMSFIKSSFIDGLSRGSLVSAIVVAVGAIVALRFLPSRAR